MYRITQELHFCYGHRLPGHPGKCGRLHGHNGILRLVLQADSLDAGGMVMDFDQVLSSMRAWLDDTLDHRLLLKEDDPAAAALHALGEPFVALPVSPTAENLARLCFEQARSQGFPAMAAEIVEQPGSIARYSIT